MVFGAIVNGIGSLISLSVASLLVYRNPTDFCALILYPMTLLNSWISSSSFWWNLLGFPYRVSCHLWRVKVWLPSCWFGWISLCCLTAEARTSNSVLNNSGENGHSCRVPDLRGEPLSFSPLRMILVMGLSCMAFLILRYDPSISTFLKVFYQERMLYFVKCFLCIYWEDHVVLALSFISHCLICRHWTSPASQE